MSSVSIAAFLEGAQAEASAATEVGGASDIPYKIPSFKMEYTPLSCPIPVGWWRSVEDSINAFAVESFLDELAAVGEWDPLEYRLALLPDGHQVRAHDGALIDASRLRRVLQSLPSRAHVARGRAIGLACHSCRGSYIAVLAEVSLDAGTLIVHRLSAAVDCGLVINQWGAEAQIEGGLVFGASAALGESISIVRGGVEQENFSDYQLLRHADCPAPHRESSRSTQSVFA
jgi:CO/xanthine dehydrogenase Mo-binding subunit